MSDQWVLEWSKRQNAFHIQEVAGMVEKNLNAMLNNQGGDYIVLCVGTRGEVDKQADRFRHYLMQRENASAVH